MVSVATLLRAGFLFINIMGLDTSHGCWHGAYSAFNRWRIQIAKCAGFPPLMLMEGFYGAENKNAFSNPFYLQYEADKNSGFISEGSVWNCLPISWDYFSKDPLSELLHHSDCDGEIAWELCEGIANRLEEVLPKLPQGEAGGHIGNWRDKTQQFIDGLRLAHKQQEDVDFH